MTTKHEDHEKHFDLFDHDNDGKLSFSEMHEYLEKHLKHKVSISLVKNLFDSMHKHLYEFVSKKEWLDLLDKKPLKDIGKDDLQKTLKIIDKNGDGKLSKYETKEVMKIKFPDKDDLEIDEMMKGYDTNKDGHIDIKEFADGFYKDEKAK